MLRVCKIKTNQKIHDDSQIKLSRGLKKSTLQKGLIDKCLSTTKTFSRKSQKKDCPKRSDTNKKKKKGKPKKLVGEWIRQKKQKYEQEISNQQFDDKQNRIKYMKNQDLLSSSKFKLGNKPTRINFMNKAVAVYELVTSGAKIPQFIRYFLGKAIFQINANVSKSREELLSYDWKLDQFKEISEQIYEKSSQEDLNQFMNLPIPIIQRWCSTKDQQAQNFLRTSDSTIRGSKFSFKSSNENKTLKRFMWENKNSQQSRFTLSHSIEGDFGGRNRLSYFKKLSKKQDQKSESMETEAWNRVERKLNEYLAKTTNKILVN